MKRDYWSKPNASGYSIYERFEGKTKLVDKVKGKDEARVCIQALRGPKETRQYQERNLDLLNRYWAKEYSRRKTTTASKESMRGAFDRLLLALGSLEIEHSRIEDLQAAVDRMTDQRRGAMCLNILRRFAGKDQRVYLNRPKTPDVAFITLKKLLELKFPEEDEIIRTMAIVSFCTGVRQGELFGIQEHNIMNQGSVVRVATQRYRDWSPGGTKRGQGRHAPVVMAGRKALKEWVKVPETQRKALRNFKFSEYMTALGGIRWHDLRHSYAVHLLVTGFRLEEVAKALGNSIVVCERYYSGYVMDAGSAAELAKKL